MDNFYAGRLGVQQRVLPVYRAPFFDALAGACQAGMSLFAGQPRPVEAIATMDRLQTAQYVPAKNRHFFSGAFYLCYQQGMLAWLEQFNPEALIVEANPRYIATPAAVRWMHKRNRPVIGWGLGAPPVRGLRHVRRQQFLSQFDALIAYSQRGAQEYARSGFPVEKIMVAHNAVAPAPPHLLPERDGYQHPPVVLFVGRLQARKRIDNLLLACAKLPENLKPRLLIVGDGPEKQRYQALAEQIYPEAQFVGEKLGDELAIFFRQADLFVLPGTGGLAVQQAMSFGLPVIVAQGDGTQDDLIRPANGWQIPPDDADALRHAMQTALAEPARLRGMGQESYRIVAEEINLEQMVTAFVRVLNRF